MYASKTRLQQQSIDGRPSESPIVNKRREAPKNHLRQALRSIQNAVHHVNKKEASPTDRLQYLQAHKMEPQKADEVIYNRLHFVCLQAALRERHLTTTMALRHSVHDALQERYAALEEEQRKTYEREHSPKSVLELLTVAATCQQMGEQLPPHLPAFDYDDIQEIF